MHIVNVGPYKVGPGQPMLLFAGPCVLEGYEHSLAIGQEVKRICEKLGMPYVFKASYDKANRSSHTSFRGPGLEEGLKQLAAIKKELGVPVISDVHETIQVEKAAEVLDVMQIPAFLCRQTDLDRPLRQCEERPVPGALGHEKCHRENRSGRESEYPPDGTWFQFRIQYTGDRYAGPGHHA